RPGWHPARYRYALEPGERRDAGRGRRRHRPRQRAMRQPVGHNERGFSLGEVLVATLVLAIGLVGITTGFQYATSGVEVGKGETTAAFLAEQRLEWRKALALTNWGSAPLKAGTTVGGYGSSPD